MTEERGSSTASARDLAADRAGPVDHGYVDLVSMVSHPINLVYDPADADVWTLAQDYVRETSIGTITVPAGFKTDLASVPNQVWHAWPKFGKWTGAAVIHDFLYRTQPNGISRTEADQVFRDLLKADGVPYGTVRLFYRMIQEFGGRAWDGHRDGIENAPRPDFGGNVGV